MSFFPAADQVQGPQKRITSLLKESKKMLHLEKLPVKGDSQLFKVSHPGAGLAAVIAIHDTTLGPALGDTRIQSYPNFEAALSLANYRIKYGIGKRTFPPIFHHTAEG